MLGRFLPGFMPGLRSLCLACPASPHARPSTLRGKRGCQAALVPVPITLASAPQQVWGDGTAWDCTMIFNDSDFEARLGRPSRLRPSCPHPRGTPHPATGAPQHIQWRHRLQVGKAA